MARMQTMVQLTDELVATLDRVAGQEGVSRSALVRSLLERSLEDDREAAISKQIVEGYRRIPQATPDEWGDLTAGADTSTREVMQRLTEEERRAGKAPW